MSNPKNGNNAQDRSEEAVEYFRSLRTDEAKLDFLLSIELQGMDEDLTVQERSVMSDEMESFFNPVRLSDQPDENGEPQEVPDPETQERRLKAFALKYAQAKFQLGLEHKEIMNSLPADQKNKEKAAGLLVQESESKKIFQSLHSMNMPLQARHDKYAMMIAEAERDFRASLTEEDKKISWVQPF